MPGASFQRKARLMREDREKLYDAPFDFVISQTVRLVPLLRASRLLYTFQPSKSPDMTTSTIDHLYLNVQCRTRTKTYPQSSPHISLPNPKMPKTWMQRTWEAFRPMRNSSRLQPLLCTLVRIFLTSPYNFLPCLSSSCLRYAFRWC